MKRVLAVGGVAALCTAALAAEFTWQGDEKSSWQDEASYQEPGKPSAGDTVIFNDRTKATVTDTDFDFVSALKWVYLKKASMITFDVTGDRQLMSCVRCYSDSRTEGNVLIKKGSGTLELAGRSVEKNKSSDDYRINLDVQEGTLMLPQDPEITGYSEILSLNVEEGATFYTAYAAMTYMSGQNLSGGGLITNANPTAYAVDAAPLLEFNSVRGTFGGVIAGNIQIQIGTSASAGKDPATPGYDQIHLDGTESTYLGQTYLYGAPTVWVKKFGNEGEPSSLGSAGRIAFAQKGATLVYSGTGDETTAKSFFHDFNSRPLTLDGGERGGVTFTGGHSYRSSNRNDHTICLDGSNTEHECVFAGSFTEPKATDGQYIYGTAFIKRGPGIWRLTDNASRKNRGLIAVEEGTLRFDSVAEAESVCSLGLSQYWRDPDMTVAIADKEVYPFAILLGGGATEGVFEYTGSTDATCSTRPIAVKGDSRIRNASDGNFHWKDVFGWGDEAKTLTLDGGAGAENVLENVTNACGVLSVVKDGEGLWTLDGDQTFNGTLDVKAGTLVVRCPATHYSWFRFLVTESGHETMADLGVITKKSSSASHAVMVEELGYYDADGNRLNFGFTWNQTRVSNADLKPGEIALDVDYETVLCDSGRTPDHLVDGKIKGNGCHFQNPNNGSDYLNVKNPGTWCGIVCRLPVDAAEVTAYDFANYAGANGGSNRGRSVECYKVQGSTDGVTWNDVTNVVAKLGDTLVEWPDNGAWNSDGTKVSAAPQSRPGKGFPINTHIRDAVSSFENVTSVSVNGGATLKADIHDGRTLTIKGLTVDPEKGAGTIDGFAFAETGTFNLTKLPTSGSKYKFTLTNCTGFENVANWSVRLDGQETGKYEIGVSEDGTVTVYRRGVLLLVR